MAKTRTSTQTQTQTARTNRNTHQRQAYTLEYAAAICPHPGLANNLSATFGLEPVDAAGIRDATKNLIVQSANVLTANLNEKALQMHLQRVIGAFVSSACGAGQIYGQKISQARDMTTRLANEDRDEDQDGPSGFDSRAARARLFAAETGLQAHAILSAAEGAVDAYADVTGETWKPYEAPRLNSQSVSRQSAAAEIAAFGE
jgi:hypothetical protein